MKPDTIVQFVSFETKATINEFKAQWETSNKLVSGKQEITLQKEVDGNKLQRYLSQHCFEEDDTQFNFKKIMKAAQDQAEIQIREFGGYSVLQLETDHPAAANECKVFVFLSGAPDLSVYKSIPSYNFLNIYQAYYESSRYTSILEFFVDNSQVAEFIIQLKIHTSSEIGVYKEINEAKTSKRSIVKKLIV